MKLAHLALGLGFASLVGCGGGAALQYKLAPETLAIPAQPKDPNCAFTISKDGPTDGSYDKLGTLTPVDFAATSQDDLKASIRPDVCKLGGDWVIATQNETGNYATALVLRKHLDQPGGAPAPAPGPAPAPTPAPTAPAPTP